MSKQNTTSTIQDIEFLDRVTIIARNISNANLNCILQLTLNASMKYIEPQGEYKNYSYYMFRL